MAQNEGRRAPRHLAVGATSAAVVGACIAFVVGPWQLPQWVTAFFIAGTY